MPEGKPAGVVCVNLDRRTLQCRIWGSAAYPKVCADFQADTEHCGADREQALELLAWFEANT